SAAMQKTGSVINIDKEANGFSIHTIRVSDNGFNGNFNIESDLVINLEVASIKEHETININLFFKTNDGTTIFATCSPKERFRAGRYTYECIIPAGTLNDILYFIDITVVENGPKILHRMENVIAIEGVEGKREGAWLGKFPGMIKPTNFKWNKKNIPDE
ncbi:MAG: hypothetical protein ACRDE8_05235, partial [Ginsengibacter sp.]